MNTNIIYSLQGNDSFINGINICFAKVLENDFSHIRVHFPETENNMEAILFIGHDRAKGVEATGTDIYDIALQFGWKR